MARNRDVAPADSDALVESPEGDVVAANLDEVIAPGDPRHGVHDPLPLERDALGVHREPTPAEVFGDPVQQVDLPEADLEDASGHRGAVVRTLSPGQHTPEQVFAGDALENEQPGAAKAKADADAKAKSQKSD